MFHQWWTDDSGKTGSDGRYAVRGFLGDYTITVTYDGRTKSVPATLTSSGSSVTVPL